MFKEYQESYATKYGSPFAAYAFESVSPQDCDESWSGEDAGGWIGRYGRRVLTEDSNGFADVTRYASEETAHEAFLSSHAPDLEGLTEDGDEIELTGGRKLRLRTESDETDPRDMLGDFYGDVEYVDEMRTRNGEHAPRPDGYNGNAEILRFGSPPNGAPVQVWWQPPTDVKRGTDAFRELRSGLVEILQWGYSSVGLEILEGVDAYRRPIVTATAWLGGVEPSAFEGDRGYLAEIVRDLALELEVI